MQDNMLTFSSNGLLPELTGGESDIFISTSEKQAGTGKAEFWLHGAYQIDINYAAALKVRPLQKAIVVTCTSNDSHITKNMVGTHMLFNDDETARDDMHIGYFNYNLSEWLPDYFLSDFYVTVSLGKYLSNTVCNHVTGGSIRGGHN